MEESLETYLTRELQLRSKSTAAFFAEQTEKAGVNGMNSLEKGDKKSAAVSLNIAKVTNKLRQCPVPSRGFDDFVIEPVPKEIAHDSIFVFIKKYYEPQGFFPTRDYLEGGRGVFAMDFLNDKKPGYHSVTISQYELDKKYNRFRISVVKG